MAYWDEYSNLQRVKHALIRDYLGGWFPKLGYWSGRVLYVDTHAGKGRYVTGDVGSPIIAVNTMLGHSHRDALLRVSEFVFHFVENDPSSFAVLNSEIAKLGTLPPKVKVLPTLGDGFDDLQSIVDSLRARGKRIAPSFVFIDPFGFSLPGALLRELMQFERVELFINVMWRELDMAICDMRKKVEEGNLTHGTIARLDTIFGSRDWVTDITSSDTDQRAIQASRLFQQMTQARWATYISMRGENKRTRYVLLHLTNHDAGRDLMKECMWKACPEGSEGFFARKNVEPGQLMLIPPVFDPAPVRAWVVGTLRSGGPTRWTALHDAVRHELWRDVHVNEAVRSLRKDGTIDASDFKPPFSIKSNPLLAVK